MFPRHHQTMQSKLSEVQPFAHCRLCRLLDQPTPKGQKSMDGMLYRLQFPKNLHDHMNALLSRRL